jgi:hypothetical protein
MKKKASEALASGMSPGAVRAFVNLGRYELDCEIPMSEPTPQPTPLSIELRFRRSMPERRFSSLAETTC